MHASSCLVEYNDDAKNLPRVTVARRACTPWWTADAYGAPSRPRLPTRTGRCRASYANLTRSPVDESCRAEQDTTKLERKTPMPHEPPSLWFARVGLPNFDFGRQTHKVVISSMQDAESCLVPRVVEKETKTGPFLGRTRSRWMR